MIDYTGLQCPICGKTFTEQDDIVVCPECGAPHHRECYTAHGRCGCAEHHGTDQAWDKQNHTAETPKKACPYCQQPNAEDAAFCNHCGRALNQDQAQTQPPPYGAPGQQPPYGAPYGGRAGPSPYGAGPFDPTGLNPDEDYDGIPARELVKVVRANPRYYMTIFARIKNLNKCRFNLAAFFLGGIWMFYRKQYKAGAIFTAINVACYLASTATSLLCTTPILRSIGVDLGLTNSTILTNTVINQIANAVGKLSGWEIFLFCLPLLFHVLQLISQIILGIKANKWYMNHCIRTYKEIEKKSQTLQEQEMACARWGGINTMNAMAVIAFYFIVNTVLTRLLYLI